MVEFDSVKVRDQLGRPDSTNITVKRFNETLVCESNSLKITESTIGNSWIVGSATNGLVGTNTNTQGGGQQVVGGSGRVETIVRVVGPNGEYREHFTTTIFKDASNTTMNWDTTNGRLSLT